MNFPILIFAFVTLITSTEETSLTSITYGDLTNEKTIRVPNAFTLRIQQRSLQKTFKSRLIFPEKASCVILFRNSSHRSDGKRKKCNPLKMGFEKFTWGNEVVFGHEWNIYFSTEEGKLDYILLKRSNNNDFWIQYELEKNDCTKLNSVVEIVGITAYDVAFPLRTHSDKYFLLFAIDGDGEEKPISTGYYEESYIRHLLRLLEVDGSRIELDNSYLHLQDFSRKLFYELKSKEIEKTLHSLLNGLLTIEFAKKEFLDKHKLSNYFPYSTKKELQSIELNIEFQFQWELMEKILNMKPEFIVAPQDRQIEFLNVLTLALNAFQKKGKQFGTNKFEIAERFPFPKYCESNITFIVKGLLEAQNFELLKEYSWDYMREVSIILDKFKTGFDNDFVSKYLFHLKEEKVKYFQGVFLYEAFEETVFLAFRTVSPSLTNELEAYFSLFFKSMRKDLENCCENDLDIHI